MPLRVHHTVTRDEFRIDRGNRRSVSPLVFKISSHSVSSDSNINSNKYFFARRRFINLQNRKKRKALEFVSIRGIIPFRSHDFNTSIYLQKYLNIFHLEISLSSLCFIFNNFNNYSNRKSIHYGVTNQYCNIDVVKARTFSTIETIRKINISRWITVFLLTRREEGRGGGGVPYRSRKRRGRQKGTREEKIALPDILCHFSSCFLHSCFSVIATRCFYTHIYAVSTVFTGPVFIINSLPAPPPRACVTTHLSTAIRSTGTEGRGGRREKEETKKKKKKKGGRKISSALKR